MAGLDSFAEQKRTSQRPARWRRAVCEANEYGVDALVLWLCSVSSMQRDATRCSVTPERDGIWSCETTAKKRMKDGIFGVL